jgi:hypothetical protein
MKPRHVELHGLTLEEAEAKIADTIDEIQQDATAAFMTSVGADFVDADAIERRAEIVRLRNQLISALQPTPSDPAADH